MKLKFEKFEWVLFLENCDFTDDELEIIEAARRGFTDIYMSHKLSMSTASISRRKNKIYDKISKFITRYKL